MYICTYLYSVHITFNLKHKNLCVYESKRDGKILPTCIFYNTRCSQVTDLGVFLSACFSGIEVFASQSWRKRVTVRCTACPRTCNIYEPTSGVDRHVVPQPGDTTSNISVVGLDRRRLDSVGKRELREGP